MPPDMQSSCKYIEQSVAAKW